MHQHLVQPEVLNMRLGLGEDLGILGKERRLRVEEPFDASRLFSRGSREFA